MTCRYDSDVWSLGITMLELATAAFPYPPERNGRRLSFWDLLDAIVESPPPTPPAHFAPHFHAFIGACLQKEPSHRASSSQLLHHPLFAAAGTIDIGNGAKSKTHDHFATVIPPDATQAEACHAIAQPLVAPFRLLARMDRITFIASNGGVAANRSGLISFLISLATPL